MYNLLCVVFIPFHKTVNPINVKMRPLIRNEKPISFVKMAPIELNRAVIKLILKKPIGNNKKTKIKLKNVSVNGSFIFHLINKRISIETIKT